MIACYYLRIVSHEDHSNSIAGHLHIKWPAMENARSGIIEVRNRGRRSSVYLEDLREPWFRIEQQRPRPQSSTKPRQTSTVGRGAFNAKQSAYKQFERPT